MFIKISTISALFFLSLILPLSVLANGPILEGTKDSTLTAEQCKSCSSDTCKQYCGKYQVGDLVKFGIKLSRIIIAISGTLSFAVMVYGGFLMVISGSSNRHEEGKKALLGAAIGLVIVFSSFVIVNYTLKAIGYERVNDWYKFST